MVIFKCACLHESSTFTQGLLLKIAPINCSSNHSDLRSSVFTIRSFMIGRGLFGFPCPLARVTTNSGAQYVTSLHLGDLFVTHVLNVHTGKPVVHKQDMSKWQKTGAVETLAATESQPCSNTGVLVFQVRGRGKDKQTAVQRDTYLSDLTQMFTFFKSFKFG